MIIDSAHFAARSNIQAMQALADSLTSEAMTVNASWPFFTANNFEILAGHARVNSFAEAIMFMPFVKGEYRKQWEAYSLEQGPRWIQQSQTLYNQETSAWLNLDSESRRLRMLKEFLMQSEEQVDENMNGQMFSPVIFSKAEDLAGGQEDDITIVEDDIPRAYYAPIWQVSPPPFQQSVINYNILAGSVLATLSKAVASSGGEVVVSEFLKSSTVELLYQGIFTDAHHALYHASSQNDAYASDISPKNFPHSLSMAPVYAHFGDVNNRTEDIVGFVVGIRPWDFYLSRILSAEVNGIHAVLSNSCAQTVTYVINGPDAIFMGEGDLHESSFDYLRESLLYQGLQESVETTSQVGRCDYVLQLYPSSVLRADYDNTHAIVFTAVLAAVFVTIGIIFLVFVVLVKRRHAEVEATATRTNAIVQALFPGSVKDRMMKDAEEQNKREHEYTFGLRRNTRKAGKREEDSYPYQHPEGDDVNLVFGSRPIADLFPETTIMFADLVGFTAWSSMREPQHVFQLLETLYHSFDVLARKRRIFKVETVGDCYVAAAGLPDPRKDHAVAMARFATECNSMMAPLVQRLETDLGPDTGELMLRIGLHSGPVTAGVLRGERARFQLFGDTMNTCARIESTGKPSRIHLSQATAEELKNSGKSHWIIARTDRVVAKGKGELATFWLANINETKEITEEEPDEPASLENNENHLSEKVFRLISWNVDMCLRLLRQIAARRQTKLVSVVKSPALKETTGTALDEVKEIISLPTFAPNGVRKEVDPNKVDLGEDVEEELRDFITSIAMLYRETNPFHNFEHASHVTMSVVKLMSRIFNTTGQGSTDDLLSQKLHHHTYGITSDPLTQFACVFSALVHDVDHRGIPNAQLIVEDPDTAAFYKNKSVAEQVSVDLAWEMLMDGRFKNLRQAIFSTQSELERFRALVVNSVMATDIIDKDLKELRNARWAKAFCESAETLRESEKDAIDRKATIVIEHIIQASDISHTMQHWHIYRKWNQRLFEEMYKAYKAGRSKKDPSDFWYQGELGFFDFYVIPLAKKLKECGVFGVCSIEYLDYAEKNRAEWAQKGQQVVAEYMERVAQQ